MSRARDLASSGVTSTVLSAKAPLASPDFTGTVDLTGTTVNFDDDEISLDKLAHSGTIGGGTIGSSVVFPNGHPILLSSSESTSAVSSVDFNNTVISTTYKHYILRIEKIIPVVNAVNLNLAFSTDNGSSFRNVATGRIYSKVGDGPSFGHEHTTITTNGLFLGYNLGSDANVGQSVEVCIFGSQDTNYNYFDVKGFLSGKHDTAHYTWWTTGYVHHAQTAINFLKLSFSSGNIAKHNLNLYGIK